MAVAVSALERKRNRATCVKVIWKSKHAVQYYCWQSTPGSRWAGGGNIKDMGVLCVELGEQDKDSLSHKGKKKSDLK